MDFFISIFKGNTGLIFKEIFRLPIGQPEAKFRLSEIFFGCPNKSDKQEMNNCISSLCHRKQTFIINSAFFHFYFHGTRMNGSPYHCLNATS